MKNLFLNITLAVIILFIIINNFIFFPGNILSYDTFGYYLYLPLKFIYHDLGLHNESIISTVLEKYKNTPTFYQAMKMPEGNYVMKYTMGLSFFYAPFFMVAHLISKTGSFPADGFSVPYQYAIFFGSILYSIIGIWALSKVLCRIFSEKITAMVLIFIVFSTNYIVHITMYGQNAMSHNYLFTTYAIIIWLSVLWHETYKLKYVVLLGILCGITILSRPSEIVCLVIPALWGINHINFLKERIQLFIKYKSQVIVFGLILIIFGMFQFIYWKIYAGKFLFNSYGGNAGEGFEFFSPYIVKILIGFRKGWLIYTPIMLFAITGFYFIYRKNKAVFYALFIYFILNLYIVSSWSCYWYAQSFSQRALIPSYPVMAIGLGYFISWIYEQNKIIKGMIFMLMFGCILLNLFQTKQFHYGIIDGDRMTKDYYCSIFGKMYATEADKKLLLIKRSFDGIETFNNENEYNSRVLQIMDFENADTKDATVFNSGKYAFKLDSTTIYSPAIEAPYYDITSGDHAWIRVTAYVYPTNNIEQDPFSLVVQFTHNEYAYKYNAYDCTKMNLELNKWNKITVNYLTPEVRKQRDYLKVYFWNRGKANVFVDDIQVEVFEKK